MLSVRSYVKSSLGSAKRVFCERVQIKGAYASELLESLEKHSFDI